MGGQINRFRSFIQGKMVGNQATDVQLPGEYQPCHFALEGEIRRIAAKQVFFVDAHGGEVDLGQSTALGVGEQEDLAGATDPIERTAEGSI